MTKVAWKLKKDDLIKAQPGITRRKFVYNLSRASYRKEWDGKYEKPGIGARILAFFIRILPKVGPLKALSFKPPTPQTDKFSRRASTRRWTSYRGLLKEQNAKRRSSSPIAISTPAKSPAPANTGWPTTPMPSWR